MTKIDHKSFTQHGYLRIKQRSNINDNELKQISSSAIKKGINFGELPSGPLKSYVGFKKRQKDKRVKLYKGYVFIFFINSKRLITCYPIPEKHLEEYNKILKKRKNV